MTNPQVENTSQTGKTGYFVQCKKPISEIKDTKMITIAFSADMLNSNGLGKNMVLDDTSEIETFKQEAEKYINSLPEEQKQAAINAANDVLKVFGEAVFKEKERKPKLNFQTLLQDAVNQFVLGH